MQDFVLTTFVTVLLMTTHDPVQYLGLSAQIFGMSVQCYFRCHKKIFSKIVI